MKNPLVNTSTISTLEMLRIAEGPWECIPLKIEEKAVSFYHVDTNPNWMPSSRWDEKETGRFGGLQKPLSKEHAIELYHLRHFNKECRWYLYSCEIYGNQGVVYFQSKVKNGTGYQINLNNAAAENYKIIKREELFSVPIFSTFQL